jgi:hypothetical protein
MRQWNLFDQQLRQKEQLIIQTGRFFGTTKLMNLQKSTKIPGIMDDF